MIAGSERPARAASAGLVLASLSAAVFLSGLDQTVVVSVLPRIITDLHVPINELDQAAWLVSAYLLGYTVAMPLVGRAADVYGYRFLFSVCAAVFAGGSWWAAVAPDLWQLVGARGLQAVGGGGMVPIALAATGALRSRRARVVALGVVTGAAEAGAVLGPLYGALMVRELGWRSVFWVNLPLTASLVVLVWAFLHGSSRRPEERVDYPGALLIGLSLLALTLGLSGGGVGIGHAYRALLFVAAAALGAGFVLRQTRARWPLVSLALFRRAPFASANVVNGFVGAALIVALVELPVFANVVLHENATRGGLTLLRLTALIPVGALAGGWLAARLPYRAVAAGGMLVGAAGFGRLSLWDAGIAEPSLSLDLALTGLGFGLVLAPLAGSALGAARGGSEAVGAASLTIARMIGMMVGLASLTTWGLAEFDRRAARHLLPVRARGQSERAYKALLDRYEENIAAAALYVFDRLFLVAAVLCVLAAVASLWLRAPDDEGVVAPPSG